MNRHERCEKTIRCQPTDRAPRYIPGMADDVASKIVGRPIHAGTGLLHYAETAVLMQGEAAHQEFEEALLEGLADLFRALDIDVYRIPWRQKKKPAKQIDEHTFIFGDPDGNHTVWQFSELTGDFGPMQRVQLTDPEDDLRKQVEATEKSYSEGALDRLSLASDYREVVERWGDEFFVPYNGGSISIGNYPENLMMLMTQPDLVKRRLELMADLAIATARLVARSGNPRVLVAGGDFAGSQGPMYSPDQFREFMLPPLKRTMEACRDLDVHYIFRSDGNLWSVADMMFQEAAIPGYGEVDRDATMTVGALREKYPQLVVWNNLSCDKVQTRSAQWVREDAQRCIDESKGVGYFQGTSNAVMPGTPVENVRAMFES